MSTPNNFTFNAACFSTNLSTFGLITIMKHCFKEIDYETVSNDKELIEFPHKLKVDNFSVETLVTFYGTNYIIQNLKVLEGVDCYIIFFDLENNDSLIELNKITGFLSNRGVGEKKIYLINIYTNKDNIKNGFSENNIRYYFSKNFLDNYDFDDINIDAPDELLQKIDAIIIETLENKIVVVDRKSDDVDNSKSNCKIF